MSGKLEHRVAMITGAGRGIGRGIAEKLAAEGASVIVNDVDSGPAHEVVAAITAAGGRAAACVGSVHDRSFPDNFLEFTLATYGDLDIVVNNAGYATYSPAEEHTDEQWEPVVDVLLNAPFRILRPIGRYWRDHPLTEGRPRRKIINIASVAGVAGGPNQISYGVGKAGQLGLTFTLAHEWAKYGVNANAICPGFIRTRLTEGRDGNRDWIEVDGRQIPIGQDNIIAALDRAHTFIPIGRAGEPGDVANAVYLFAIPESDYITGQAVLVDGGLRLGR